MGSPVARFPRGAGDDGDGVPPVEVYKAAIDEYRFQAQFNWTRTQYMIVFNAGILVAATAVASRSGHGAVLVFAFGVVTCALAVLVMRTQHDYYRAARDRMKRIEAAVGIPLDQRVDSTATMGKRRRTASVTQLVYLLTAGIALANAVGAVIVGLR